MGKSVARPTLLTAEEIMAPLAGSPEQTAVDRTPGNGNQAKVATGECEGPPAVAPSPESPRNTMTRERMCKLLRDGGQFIKHDEFCDIAAVVFLTGLSRETVRKWHYNGTGPPRMNGPRAFYQIDHLLGWWNNFFACRRGS